MGRRPAGLPPNLIVDVGAVSLGEGLRAALSVAAIVALAQWVQVPGLMEAALAALLSCLCDAGGSVRTRATAIVSFGLLGAAITAGFGLLRGGPLWLVVVAAGAGLFATSFARVGGQAAMQVGNLLSVVLVLAVRAPFPDLATAATVAGLFLAGNVWALLLTLVIWRVHPHGPARRATAAAMRQLAALAADMRATLASASGTDEAAWDRHARLHRRLARETIERARERVLQTAQMRGPASSRSRQASARLEAVDQLFGLMIALSDGLQDDATAAERATKMLRLLPPVLLLLARAVAADTPSHGPALIRAIAAIGRAGAGTDWLAAVASELAGRLRVVATVSGGQAEAGRTDAVVSPLRHWREAVRRNLDFGSEALRHALRVLAVSVPAFAITLGWPRSYEHWFTITLILTMQPYFALTVMRAVERIGGTVFGGVLAAALALVCTTPLAMAGALFPLTILAFSVRAVSFGLFIACLTPLVVLLSELGQPGADELSIALFRAGFTVAGGLLALAGNLLLWPSWEPGRLAHEARAAIAAHGRYARAAIGAVLGDDPHAVDAARRAAGVASNALEASLQRVLLEPLRGRAARVEAALAVDATLRRMAGALAGLRVRAAGHAHDPDAWRNWAAWLERAMSSEQRPGGPPALPPHDEDAATLARLARQIELATGAAARL